MVNSLEPRIDSLFTSKRKRPIIETDDKISSPKVKKIRDSAIIRRPKSQRCLFPSQDGENLTKLKSPTKSTPPKPSRKSLLDDFVCVRRCLASSNQIVGREAEMNKIKEILDKHITTQKSTSLYISGVPGTGKTVCVTQTINKLMNQHEGKIAFLNYNSMEFKPSKTIYNRIFNDLSGAKINKSSKNKPQEILKLVQSSKKMVILVLDEIDKLVTSKNDNDLLISIFDLATNSKLILIGIANTLDLTQSSLCKLSAFAGKLVQRINFKPYSEKEILQILNARLSKAPLSVFDPKALILCAKTVSKHYYGDIRKALDICGRSLDIIEREISPRQFSPLKRTADDGLNPGSPRKSPRKGDHINPESLVVNLVHIAKVIGQSGTIKVDINDLTQQQMVILCILLCFAAVKKQKEIDISICHHIYGKTSRSKGLFNYTLPFEAFLTMCNVLESRNLLNIKYAKDHQKSKISLALDENELIDLIKDKPFFKTMLIKIRSLI